jgi:amino acid transporter
MHKKISLFSLVLLIVAAIDSIRNFPSMALFGSSLVFFFVFSALFFLLPISLVSAEFASRNAEEGGVFHWVRQAFGRRVGVLAVWLQWINTMVWYPTILSFIAGTAAYLVNPALGENKAFVVSVVLAVFWGLTLLNLRGIQISARLNAWCGSIGTLVPIGLLIVFGFCWFFGNHPVEIAFTSKTMLPSLSNSNNWVSLIAIMASFLGMELAGVHVNDIHNPQKNFPRALGLSVIILFGTMLLGALSIAVVIPDKQIQLVAGVMQTFQAFFEAFGLSFLMPVLTVLVLIGSVGMMINWLLSPAKGLLQAAEFGFLPKFFMKKNEHGVAVRILLAQAVLVTVFCLVLLLMPSINAFYWFLTALSTDLYMCMYVLVFLAALKLGRPPREGLHYRIPKGSRRLACIMGLLGCAITLIVGYFPPSDIQVGGMLWYGSLIGAGHIIAIAPVFLLWWYQASREKSSF